MNGSDLPNGDLDDAKSPASKRSHLDESESTEVDTNVEPAATEPNRLSTTEILFANFAEKGLTPAEHY